MDPEGPLSSWKACHSILVLVQAGIGRVRGWLVCDTVEPLLSVKGSLDRPQGASQNLFILHSFDWTAMTRWLLDFHVSLTLEPGHMVLHEQTRCWFSCMVFWGLTHTHKGHDTRMEGKQVFYQGVRWGHMPKGICRRSERERQRGEFN